MADKRHVAVILIIVIVIALVLILVGGLSLFGEGYRVEVYGFAVHDDPFIGDESWDVSFSDYRVDYDTDILTFQPAWFWESSNHIVEITISSGGNSYTQSADIGSFTGSKSFSLTFRHVPQGIYQGTITLYQMQGGFFGLGANKVRRTSCQINELFIDLET